MDALDIVDFLEDVVFPVTIIAGIALALVTRYYRVNFQQRLEFNKIFSISPEVNQLIVIPETSTLLTVWTINLKRLFKVERIGNKWYIQDASNKKNLVTMRNGVLQKFIVLNTTVENRAQSPLNTTPSVLKVSQNWKLSKKSDIDLGLKTDFTFGNNHTFLRWVGLTHLEIIMKEHDPYVTNSQIIVHQRVGISKEYNDGNLTGYLIFFDYDKINVEVLISTFIFALLVQRSTYRGVLKQPKKKLTISRIKGYMCSFFS